MKVIKSGYKDIESLKLVSDDMEVQVLPLYGGKVASVYSKKNDYEYLVQAPGDIYRKQQYDSVYTDGECSGFDDMFPTIDECCYEEYPWKGTALPDHGEVWSLKWNPEYGEDFLKLSVNGVRLPYRLEKEFRIENDRKLVINYRLTNPSVFPMDFLWAAHIMINIVEGTKIILPSSAEQGTTVFSKSGRIGSYGETFNWPEVNRTGNDAPLNISRSASAEDMEKYYIKGAVKEGRCELKYPDGKGLCVCFSQDTVPYLGILLNENGWNNNGRWNSLYNIFIEPSTSTFDRIDAARLRDECSRIEPESEYCWTLSVGVY